MSMRPILSLTRSVISISIRGAGTSAPPPPPTTNGSTNPNPQSKSTKTPLESTTFSGKSHPSEYYERPEHPRGMPPSGVTPPWNRTPLKATGSSLGVGGEGKPEEAFMGPSRPRLYYDRPQDRALPKINSRAPMYTVIAVLGLTACTLFVLNAHNSERLASSVMRQVMFQLRNSKDVMNALGQNVRFADNWWGFGQPWTSGNINMMQGRVDLKFRITGSKGDGTVFFTSIRPAQEGAWRIVRFKVNTDSGESIRLEDQI